MIEEKLLPQELRIFTRSLDHLGKRLNMILSKEAIFDDDRSAYLKEAALHLAKVTLPDYPTLDPTQGYAGPDDILDRVTASANTRGLSSIFGLRTTQVMTADLAKSLLDNVFDSHPHYSKERMLAGKPQLDDFRNEAGREIAALDAMTSAIREKYMHVAYSETLFIEKAEIFRSFENHEIGYFYEWQLASRETSPSVEDPFIEADIETAVECDEVPTI